MITHITRQMRSQLCHYISRVIYLVPYTGSTEVPETHQFSSWACGNVIIMNLKKLSFVALSFSYQIILLGFFAKQRILNIGCLFLFLVFLVSQVEYQQLYFKEDHHLPFSNIWHRVLHCFLLQILVLYTINLSIHL